MDSRLEGIEHGAEGIWKNHFGEDRAQNKIKKMLEQQLVSYQNIFPNGRI